MTRGVDRCQSIQPDVEPQSMSRYRGRMELTEPSVARLGKHLPRLADALRASLRLTLDAALPPLCPACREPVGQQGGLCPACWSKLAFIAPPYCERLGIPFAYDPGPGILSMQAIADPPAYRRARAAVRYDEVSRVLVHALKYGDRLDLAPTLGRWMAQAGRELIAEADALVPVPLHWSRRSIDFIE
jgi:predicted amidophosphoribosyltransferase